MLIDFKNMTANVIKNFKGGEKEAALKIYDDNQNKIICGKLIPGASIGLHTHETDCEIIYILSGKGKVLYDGEYEIVSTGDCHYCPNGHSHSLINDSDDDLIFFAVVPTK